MKNMRSMLLLLCLALINSAPIQAQVRKVNAISIVVSDMDRSVNFYNEVLSFKKVSDKELYGEQQEQLFGLFGIRQRVVRMQLGEEFIELIDYLTTGGRPIPEDARSNDLFFQHIAIVVSDMDSAYNILRKFRVPHVSTSPQTLPVSNIAAAGIRAFYFQDPDRHNLEVIYFPNGKGQDKWQNARGRIFLGIDHTAIGVSSTEKSHRFYMDLLGVDRKGDSWNKGIEQAHLNNVESASLHITGYRSFQGPGIEFLQYLVPGPGKQYPDDTRADDLWNWHISLQVDDVEKLYAKLQAAGQYRFVSKQVIVSSVNGRILRKSFMIRDPDGHALLLEQGPE